MSSFTNYESAAATKYDITRLPVGVKVMELFIRRYSPVKYEETKLIDFGTGTGNYVTKLLQSGLAHCTCVDFSDTMLEGCKTKMAQNDLLKRVKFVKAFLPHVELESGSYDAVKTSMVIHHLVNTNDNGVVEDWSPIVDTFKEANRLLSPIVDDGVFVVAFSTPEQRGGNWYAHLVPKSRQKTIARCPSKQQVRQFLKDAGFAVIDEHDMMTHYVSNEVYYNKTTFVSTPGAWFMDSLLSAASKEEMDAAKETVRKLHANDTLKDFIHKHDDFKTYGCGTIVAAVKKNAASESLSENKLNGHAQVGNGHTHGHLNGHSNGLNGDLANL